MRIDVHELPAFVELAQRLGADAIRAQHVISMTVQSVGESLVGDPEGYDRCRAQVEERAREIGIEFGAPAPFSRVPAAIMPAVPAAIANGSTSADAIQFNPFESAPTPRRDDDLAGHVVPCRQPNRSAVILYAGRVFSCCHPMAHEKMELGDLHTTNCAEV
jgi:hypothetical protein